MMTETAATVGGKTAAEWREEASACHRRSQESWERSDTDGFLSQWASDQMALRYQRLAAVAENGGMVEALAFVDLATGELVKGELEQGQYGAFFRPFDRDRGLIFFSHARNAATRAANNAKKGVREVTCRVPALVNTREMRAYADPAAEWVVVEGEA